MKEIPELIHELADAVVNDGGYADDPEEQERRHYERDSLEEALNEFLSGRVR